MKEFKECETCAAKAGSPYLCKGCLHNRTLIDSLKEELKEAGSTHIHHHYAPSTGSIPQPQPLGQQPHYHPGGQPCYNNPCVWC
jgi:hypothetical protein